MLDLMSDGFGEKNQTIRVNTIWGQKKSIHITVY